MPAGKCTGRGWGASIDHGVGLLEGFGEGDGTAVDEVLFTLAPGTE